MNSFPDYLIITTSILLPTLFAIYLIKSAHKGLRTSKTDNIEKLKADVFDMIATSDQRNLAQVEALKADIEELQRELQEWKMLAVKLAERLRVKGEAVDEVDERLRRQTSRTASLSLNIDGLTDSSVTIGDITGRDKEST